MRTVLRVIGRGLALVVGLSVLLVAYTWLRFMPVWQEAEDVSFMNGEVRLVGTLYRPGTEGTFPAVIVLHGSGPETRAEPRSRI
ncbi:MAG: hypothetical protein OEY08_17880, partial [Gammaproteobacteria bacterium]|nr:hypothetical protein [Gammaproteobacteria bacterium]